MVQLKCPECGKKFSTPTAKCPHCGSQINKDGKVMVISLVKNLFDFPDFYRNPTIEIRQNGFKHVGEVNYNEKFELAIDKECELIFKCNLVDLPFATCVVKPGDVVYLTYYKGLNCLRTIKIHNKEYNFPVIDKTNKHKVNPVKLIVLVLILALVCFLGFFKSHQRKAAVYQETVSRTYEESQSYEISYPADIPEIQEQAAVVRNAKKNFDIEFAKALDKLSAPAYQGIMAQKIFWEANEALDKLEIESRKLEILLRRNDFQEYAEQEREEREALKEKYRMVKRNLQR